MKMCQSRGFRSAVADDSVLMVYDAASRGNQIPTFRRNVTPEDEDTTSFRNVGIQLRPNAASYAARTETLKQKLFYLLFINDMKRMAGRGGQFHVFLTSVPDGNEWSSSRSGRLTLEEQPPLSTACVWSMSHYQLQQNMSIRHMQKHTTAHTGYSCLIFLSIPIIWNENIQQAHSAMSHRRWKFLWPAAHIPL